MKNNTMKNKTKLWDFVHGQEPRLMGDPFGRFNVKEEKDFFIIECELLTNLVNPFINTELKTCRVDKKSFTDFINKQNPIIFY
jgi:hypothetical protein